MAVSASHAASENPEIDWSDRIVVGPSGAWITGVADAIFVAVISKVGELWAAVVAIAQAVAVVVNRYCS